MSLVNDMLRDLENRRAGPDERVPLVGLHAVDEAAARRRERIERLRRGSIWFAAVMLIALLVGMMIGRLVRDPPAAPLAAPEPVAVQPVAAAQVLDVLPQHDGQRFVLQLLLDRSVPYRRIEQSGAVSLLLEQLSLSGEARHGRVQRDGRSLSWRVEARNGGVQVLLVGLSGEIQVSDRLEAVGDRWQLWIEVPLQAPEAAEPALELPVAQPAETAEQALPAWLTQAVPAADAAPAAAEPPLAAVSSPAPAAATPAPAQLNIRSHTPSPLEQARQALQVGEHGRAIELLERLVRERPTDAEVAHTLARAYLLANQPERLLAWAPQRLAQTPRDSQLRMLLARTRLQLGDTAGAIATLEEQTPPLLLDSDYHALLAALYQQAGDWQRSAAVYRQLVALRPEQAAWQLGLGIALEQLGEDAEAAGHYRQAARGTTLDESARRFASERAAALGER